MAKDSLLGRVQAGIRQNRCGMRPWVEKLPPKVQADMEQVRDWYRSQKNKIHLRAVARSLSTQLKAQGFRIPSVQTIEVWLRKEA